MARPLAQGIEVGTGCDVLNLEIGSKIEVNNEALILTRKGARGHAVYGPYDQFTPGRYLVEFGIAPVDGQRFDRDSSAPRSTLSPMAART
jgi:hypothetical protein